MCHQGAAKLFTPQYSKYAEVRNISWKFSFPEASAIFAEPHYHEIQYEHKYNARVNFRAMIRIKKKWSAYNAAKKKIVFGCIEELQGKRAQK